MERGLDAGHDDSMHLPALETKIPGGRWPLADFIIPGSKLPLSRFLRLTLDEIRTDHVGTLAGNVAFRLLFAALPMVVTILWILRMADAERLVDSMLDVTRLAFPGASTAPVEEQLQKGEAGASLSFGFAISLAVSLWAITVAFQASMQALNTVYGVKERRTGVRRLAISALVAVVAFSLFLMALVLIVFGTEIAEGAASAMGLGLNFRFVFAVVSWFVVIACVSAAFACTYYFAPDVQQELRWIRFGSVAAVLLWLAFTMAFSLYVNFLATPEQTYGAFSGIAVFMLYLYGCTFIVLLGAEMNQVLEDANPEGKNDGQRKAGAPKTK